MKAVWQRKKLFEDPKITPEEVLEFNKVNILIAYLSRFDKNLHKCFLKKQIGDNYDLTDAERAKLVAHKILRNEKKSLAHYRINGVRMLSGGRKTEMELSEKLDKVLKNTESEVSLGDDDIQIRGNFNKDLSENGTKSVIEFQASSYAVLENEQICRITIERYGKLDQEVTFRYK